MCYNERRLFSAQQRMCPFLDNPDLPLFIIMLLFLVAASSFFALMETAITESHKSRLERLADDGSRDAAAALKIVEMPERILPVVQIGITLASIFLGVLIGGAVAPFWAAVLDFLPYAHAVALCLSTVFIAYFSLLMGEFLPKKIAWQNPEKYLQRFHRWLYFLEHLTRPAVSFLSGSANFLLLLVGINPHVVDTVTEDEVKDLIEQGTEDGTFEKTEQTMVDNIFHMSDQTAYALMTPRTQMFWIDLEDSLEHNLQLIKENPDTVIPVGRDSLDNFCGILYAKDLLNASLAEKELELSAFVRQPMFVPRSMETFRVLEKFRETGVHEAVVLDEYGGVIGFLTLTDIMSEIIGESFSSDEFDAPQMIPRGKDAWYMDGLFSIDDFKEKFDIDTPLPDEDKAHFQTMGGFLTSYFGYIPKETETCRWGDFTFEIVDMDRARIDKILVTHKAQPSEKKAD